MTPEEKTLLLTVARVLHAKCRSEVYAEAEDDCWALHDALKPFNADGGVPFSEIVNASNQEPAR